ncbi:hemophore [Mycobacterium sp. URHB0044]|uniref:hemophore n=1 Tax=Mycobacterium sp. URHB0044 TaxID=1380386 RepID=UPI00049079F2|nr:hemophore [Mycobacterium sp. URHB0044]
MTWAFETFGTARRGLGTVFAVTAAGGVVVAALGAASPSATAASDPCAASEVAKTVGSVATSMGTYLDSHPQTNAAMTTISQQQGGAQSLVALKAYFDANPQASKDMQQLQQPLVNLSTKCRLPLTLPQLMGLLQGAGSQAGSLPGAASPASLPTGPATAQTVAVPGTVLPAQPSPASTVGPGTGPLPGPSAATTR